MIDSIIQGDCLQVLKSIGDDSIDLVITDPPYGYSFMGKDWDKAVPSVGIWQECLRVLKPGAFAFVMSAPRQDVLAQMIVRLGDAGFETGFTSLYHAYASGFPKAANVGKLVDKRLGAERDIIGIDYNVLARNPENPHREDYSGELKDGIAAAKITAPATQQAKALEGSYAGFQPKPAVEIIIVVMKALSEKTYVDQALANGKGISWLDNCRIPYQNESDRDNAITVQGMSLSIYGGGKGLNHEERAFQTNPQGRFPANLIVSDDVLNDGKITKSTKRSDAQPNIKNNSLCAPHGVIEDSVLNRGYSDSGSFSRYFSLDAWVEKTLPFLIVPKASKSEKNKGLETQNTHPTVKPIKLMSYLITLGSRPNDIVLDPFCGSGTTCIAAKQLERRYIGIENNLGYCKIANTRLSATTQPSTFNSYINLGIARPR